MDIIYGRKIVKTGRLDPRELFWKLVLLMFDKSAREKSQNVRTTVCKTGLKIEIGQFESVRRGSRE